nr:nucleosome assembly protein 1;4-like [Ipomoea trifida]
MNSDEDRVDASAARILRNQLLSFERGPEESFQSLNTSPEVQRRVIALREIQNNHDEFEVEYNKEKAALDAKYRKIYYALYEQNKHGELEVEYTMEKAALDAKYQKIYYPLYQQRFKIVSGAEEVEGNNGTQNIGVEGDKDKGIPSFWLVAMKNNQQIAKAICEKDEGALAFLKDIEWSMVDTESFKIDFFFEKSNPFFSNPVLTKTYYYMLRHEILLGTEGSLIEWYPGKSLTENTTRKKVIDKRAAVLSAKNKEPMTETEEESFSFFNFFSPLEVLMADNQAQEAKQLMQDYRIGITIRDKIIPDALYWYTGEALEDDEDDDDYEDDEDEDDYEDDEDDEEYEDEDDYEDDEDDEEYEDEDDYEDDEDDEEYEDDNEYEDEDEDYNDGNYQGKGDMDDDNASKTD